MFTLSQPLQFWSPLTWALFNLLALAFIAAAVWVSFVRKDFLDHVRVNHWLFISFVLCCLWLIKAQIMDNLYIHLIGASVAYLILGAPMAILALACTTLVTCITLQTSPWIWGLQFILASIVPLLCVAVLHRVAAALFPQRLFVYIFVRGFFVSAIAMMLSMFFNLALINELHLISLAGNQVFWASPILLGWGEGFLSGGVIAIVATYHPEWLYRHRPFTGM